LLDWTAEQDRLVRRRRDEPSAELLETLARIRELSSFIMGMDAKLDVIIGLLDNDDAEEEEDGNRADS
jgi:hypothetical protein